MRMHPRHSIAIGFLLVLLSTTLVGAQDRVAIRCGQLIDGRSSAPRTDVVIVVEGEKIVEVREGPNVPDGMRFIDYGNGSCLPGLIDLHAHILINPTGGVHNDLGRSSADRALDGLRNAQTMLRAGFTTLRDPGDFDAYYAGVSIKRAIAAGEFVGPRLFIAPHAIGPTGGHGDVNDLSPDLSLQVPTRTADGPDELRKAIREEVKYGADWIKLMATGGVMSAGDNPNHTAYTDAEFHAAVDETHRLGRKITVHAIGTAGIKAAVRAGVDAVEHGILIDEEGIALMKERGTWLVPTLYVLNYVVEEGPRLGYAEESVEKARALLDVRDANIRRAFEAGVKIAFGSDTIFPHEQATREFAHLVRLGMSPMRAIQTATVNAAQVLGVEREIGAVAPGMYADIIAVDGDPLDDITELEDVDFVMHGGQVIKDERPRT